MLELASDLGNVSKACRIVGYSRQQFYEIRRNFQAYGAEGLLDKVAGPRNPHPNRVAEEVEAAILAHALEHPCHGALRVANELALKGVQVSSDGRARHLEPAQLAQQARRLLRLERTTAERTVQLSDEQIEVLERFSPEFRERHIETPFTGDLLGVDTFFVGHFKGVGKVYLQSAIDCCSRYGWGRLYVNKLPLTAVHLLNTDVLPTFEAHGGTVKTVLSDNGNKFCGRPDKHPYELFVQLEGIRTSQDEGPPAAIQRHHRALPTDAARRALPR